MSLPHYAPSSALCALCAGLQHGYLFVVQKGSFYSLNVTDIEHSLMGQKAVATDVIAIDSI